MPRRFTDLMHCQVVVTPGTMYQWHRIGSEGLVIGELLLVLYIHCFSRHQQQLPSLVACPFVVTNLSATLCTHLRPRLHPHTCVQSKHQRASPLPLLFLATISSSTATLMRHKQQRRSLVRHTRMRRPFPRLNTTTITTHLCLLLQPALHRIALPPSQLGEQYQQQGTHWNSHRLVLPRSSSV